MSYRYSVYDEPWRRLSVTAETSKFSIKGRFSNAHRHFVAVTLQKSITLFWPLWTFESPSHWVFGVGPAFHKNKKQCMLCWAGGWKRLSPFLYNNRQHFLYTAHLAYDISENSRYRIQVVRIQSSVKLSLITKTDGLKDEYDISE